MPEERLELRVQPVRRGIPLPDRAYLGDAGLDLVAAVHAVIDPGQRAVVGCGIAVELPPGHCGLVLPRSGLASRHGVTVLNAPGLVDEGYRGEVRVCLHNTDLDRPFTVHPGMRIAQLVVMPVPHVEVVEVDALSPSHRDVRGYGSSGLR